MYFSRLSMKGSAEPPAFPLGNGDYSTHRLVWTFFGDGNRDFVYRAEMGSRPEILCVSCRKPVDETGAWTVEAKPYDPRLPAGTCLRFSTRVNPVVARADAVGRSRRHDVVMDVKKRCRERSEATFSHSEAVQQACAEWLLRREQRLGIQIEEPSLRCDGYRVLRIRRPRGSSVMTLGTVDIAGVLTVVDAERFRDVLFHGLGHGKGFGCGLVMVKRA